MSADVKIVESLKRRQNLCLVSTLVLLALAVAVLVMGRRPPAEDVNMDAVNRLLYVIYKDRHPRPAGLGGTPAVDQYNAEYMSWREDVVREFCHDVGNWSKTCGP